MPALLNCTQMAAGRVNRIKDLALFYLIKIVFAAVGSYRIYVIVVIIRIPVEMQTSISITVWSIH